MAFPPSFLDEVRARISLPDLVGRRVRLTRRGRDHTGLCPFHNEKTGSFHVYDDHFHCFGCGAHGDAIGYVMRTDNLDFVEAVERLAGEAGLQVPQETPEARQRAHRQKTLLETLAAAASFYEAHLWAPSGARAREYLTARGLDEETIRRFRLGWAGEDRQALRRSLGKEFPEALLSEAGLLRTPEDGGTPYDYFHGRVMFPIGDRAGRVIAFGARTLGDGQPKYLNSPDTPLFEKGRVLYGLSVARANATLDPDGNGPAVIVTEGYMDVIALHRAGFSTAVAPLGTALTEAQLQELWRLSSEPVLCLDSDKAGGVAAIRAMNRALPLLTPGHSLRFVVLPAREDPDSLIRSTGTDAFAKRLAGARTLSQFWWDCELEAWPLNTPERRADLERRLMEGTNLIADRVVQAAYRRFFREHLFQLDRPASGRVARPGPGPTTVRTTGRTANLALSLAREGPPPPPPRSPGRVNRELFLAVCLHHPSMVDEWVEEIAALDIPEPALDSLRHAILEIAHAHPGLDAKTLQQHLALCGHTEMLNALATTIARDGAFAARGGDDPEVIRRGLREILQLLHAQGPGDADSVWQVGSSDDDLQRLTARKERELQDGPIGGM